MSYCIQMGSGKVVDPFALREEDVVLDDIVNNLAHEVRFGGSAGDWTVAQHTLVVAELVRKFGTGTDEEYMSALLHDAGEAYLKDMPKPIKHRPEMLAYRQAEERAMRVVCEKFGVPCDLPIVKEMDNVATYLEAKMFLGKLAECWAQWKPDLTAGLLRIATDEILNTEVDGFRSEVRWRDLMRVYFETAEPPSISQRSDLGDSFEAQLAEELGLNGEQSAPTALVKGKKRNELGEGAEGSVGREAAGEQKAKRSFGIDRKFSNKNGPLDVTFSRREKSNN